MFVNSRFSSIFIRQNLTAPQFYFFRNYVPEYNKRKVHWILRKLNGLFARYPNFLQYSIFGTSISFIVYFVASARYRDSQLRKTLTKDEYLMYHLKKKAVLTQRCSFGTDLYIPFLNKDIATEQDERTEEIYFKT